MKAIVCVALIVVCGIAFNQAIPIDAENVHFEHNDFDVTFEHSRQRRDSKGQASIDVQRQRGTTSVNAQVGRVWSSNNGRTTVEANANYGRDYGRHGSRPNYGGNVQLKHRW